MSRDVMIFNVCDHFSGHKQYTVELCPKCLGSGYYYDVAFDANGRAVLATGTIKLQQEVLKCINDVKGDNIFFENWGSEVHDVVGRKETRLTSAKLEMMILQALEYLRYLQADENDVYANMTSDEILLGVKEVSIDRYAVGYDVGVTFVNTSDDLLSQTILI